jgi:DNA repair exonuclease SbcCD ATPase subunit
MREIEQTLKYLLSGALREACMYDDPDCDAAFHCCDWNIAVDKIRQALAGLESGELVVTYKERIDFVESTVSSAIKGLLPDIQNEEQRKLMEEAIEATSHLREYLCGVDLQRREEEASPCPVCGRPWDTSKHVVMSEM